MKHFKPNLLMYANVMSACARNGRVGNVLKLPSDMRVNPNLGEILYDIYIYIYTCVCVCVCIDM